METKNIVVVGGGAAGFFCAIQIAEKHPNWQVTIVEKSAKLLSKVRVSGGGRCNVTHACPDVDHLIQKYPRGQRFLKKAFYQFATLQTIDWFIFHLRKAHRRTTVRPLSGVAWAKMLSRMFNPCFACNREKTPRPTTVPAWLSCRTEHCC